MNNEEHKRQEKIAKEFVKGFTEGFDENQVEGTKMMENKAKDLAEVLYIEISNTAIYNAGSRGYNIDIFTDSVIKELNKLGLRPKSKWIIDENGDYHCEKCKAIIEKDEWERHNYNYCYHCGADMRGEEE